MDDGEAEIEDPSSPVAEDAASADDSTKEAGEKPSKRGVGKPAYGPSTLPPEEWRSTHVSIPRTFAVAGDLDPAIITNHVPGYTEQLDYIFFDADSFSIASSLPTPRPDDLPGHLPNEFFPSDHLAVVYDLEWRDFRGTGPSS